MRYNLTWGRDVSRSPGVFLRPGIPKHRAFFGSVTAVTYPDRLGRTQLTIASDTSHRMVGPDLDHLTHDCQVTLASDRDPQPSNYSDSDWIAATYALPTGEIYALIHDEYHGAEHVGACPSGVFLKCRWNTMT